ncbi:MAG: radical SAM protein [Thermoanaerobaculales bacterium]|jgi:radical SAM superfamily enzyme YgiQ (UPF0313 family)|nr:radical SAM protein [Thermoanaerobaculales bacterium]
MKILIILPAVERVRVTADEPRVPDRKMKRFSVLPLTTVAALTPPHHEVVLCDENVEPLDLESNVDVAAVSFMTAYAPRAYEIADAFRARGVVTVAGGFHPTFMPDEAAEHFDSVVVGEAEGSWPELLEDLEAGRLQQVYRRDAPCDPSEIPVPRRDLTARNARHYVTTAAVQAGRGCRHGCRYCSVTAFYGRTHRNRPLDSVLAELAELPRDFMFVDDNIIADREYAKTLFRAMAPLKKRWVSQASLEIADDPELLRLARAAGCLGLFIGIETLGEDNLAAVEKGFNDRAGYRRKIAAVRKAGIGIIAGIIVGMDGDDVGTFERMLRFLDLTGIDAIQVNIMTPLPGTPLWTAMEDQGRILDRDWSHYDFRHCVIRPVRMSAGECQAGADWLYSRFYRLDRILNRFARGLFTLGPAGALLGLKLGMTYRYDNKREGIVGSNPAVSRRRRSPTHRWLRRVHEPSC